MKFFSKRKRYLSKINDFFNILDSYENKYIPNKIKNNLIRKYNILYIYFKNQFKINKIKKFIKIYSSFDSYVDLHNSIYTKNQLVNFGNLLSNIDGKSLDNQQRMAVLSEEQNNLIVAGAGSGKTLTISGKVKYLIESGKAKTEEILLISFTDKAVKEMTERLKRIDIDVNSKTFHKLGLDIITSFKKSRPNIATGEFLDQIFHNYFKHEILNFPEQMKFILDFMSAYLYIPEDISEFKTLGDYIDNFRNIDYETLEYKYLKSVHSDDSDFLSKLDSTHKKVRRLDDLIISNFLFLNNINYIYDFPYPYEPEESFYKRIKTNFFLPDYDIHLEHFSIDEKGRAKFLTKYEEQKYLDEIKLKRELHSIHNTKLIETFSYYNKDYSLLDKITSLLQENHVNFQQNNISNIFNNIYILQNDKQYDEFIKLISTFLSLFKSNNLQLTDIENLILENKSNTNIFMRNRNDLFLKIFSHFYKYYQNQLLQTDQIDFNDMINNSTEIVKLGFLPEKYKYIIIDEYQDISVSRYKLIKEIQKQCNSQIFCVGDDWQSIYRFSGSDIDLFSNFNKYFPNYRLLKIEKTYRNSQELIDIASKFVIQNPNQLIKNLKSDKHLDSPIKVVFYKENITDGIEKAIQQIVMDFGEEKTILLLGRTRYDISPILQNEELFNVSHENNNEIIYSKMPNLKISFMTVHKSKGLEADNVIIVNMQNSMLGFPNRISSDPVLSLVLNCSENFPYAEERRLFYVAITRTKNHTFLVAPEKNYSQFLDEMITNKSISPELENKLDLSNPPKCLKCGKGTLILRTNPTNNTEFLGCSNFPHCDYTLNDINILQKQVICNKCGGYFIEINSKNGKFYGCSNYPFCKNTKTIDNT